MNTNSPRVLVLGTGPAALLVAHVAKTIHDCADIHIMSRSLVRSPIYGCQYLHADIYGLDLRETTVQYELIGDAESYREKVYGAGWMGSVSAEDLLGEHRAWDLRQAYDQMWERYFRHSPEHGGLRFTPLVVTPDRLRQVTPALREDFDIVISTVPANALCLRPEEHTFASQEIWAAGDAPELDRWAPVSVGDDLVVCNGNPEPGWYRACKVFGSATVEWPVARKPPYDGVALVEKPLRTDCNCFPWIHRLGRYGAWRKSILLHDVFQQADLLLKVAQNHTLLGPRKDLCVKCGHIASSERNLICPIGIEYRCTNGHSWEVGEDGKVTR
jgi:hypothetical protein